MRQSHNSDRHGKRMLSSLSMGILAVLLFSMVPGQAFGQAGLSCNSEMLAFVQGPGSPTDPIFLDDEITVTNYMIAGEIEGGTELSLPNFGFAADCKPNLDGLTYDNCVARGNTINYLGGIVVSDNCVNANGEKIEFPGPQSSFIDFIPTNGPMIIPEFDFCRVSWKFEVTALKDLVPNVPTKRAILHQALSFPLSAEALDPDPFVPAICDNGRETNADQETALIISTCDIEVKKQICSLSSPGACSDNSLDSPVWFDADDVNSALLLSANGKAAYRAIITNTGTVDYVDDIIVNDPTLGIINLEIPPLAKDASVIIGGENAQEDFWKDTCESTANIMNTLDVQGQCRRK